MSGEIMSKLEVMVYKTLFDEEFTFKRTKSTFLKWIIKARWKQEDYVRLSTNDLRFVLNSVLYMLPIPVGENYLVTNSRSILEKRSKKEEGDNAILLDLVEDLQSIITKYDSGDKIFLFEF